MNVEPTAAPNLARQRIHDEWERNRYVVELARFASLAVRIDARLLRALRVELMPAADAGVEADLWFSSLIESRSSQGFVLNPRIANELRRELADYQVSGQQRELQAAWRIVEREHRDWPPSLRLEERITYLALTRPGDPAGMRARDEEIEALLRQVARAMTENETRGLDLARWAQRALRGLPEAALQTESALTLAVGASERLGGRVALPVAARQELPQDFGWILPNGRFASTRQIAVRRLENGIELFEAAEAPLSLTVPRTSPVVLQVSWLAGPIRTSRTVAIGAATQFVETPAGATDIRFQTLDGQEFELRDDSAANTTASVDLNRVCVRVRTITTDGVEIFSTGFFVTPDLILAAAHAVRPADWDADAERSASYEITLMSGLVPESDATPASVSANVVAVRASLELALLRLEHPVTWAQILPWLNLIDDSVIGAEWTSASTAAGRDSPPDGAGVRTLTYLYGRVQGITTALPELLSGDGRILDLTLEESIHSPPGLALSGAPVIVNGRVAGIVVMGTEDENPRTRRLYATPASLASGFVTFALRDRSLDATITLIEQMSVEYTRLRQRQSAPPDEWRVQRTLHDMGFNVAVVRSLIAVEMDIESFIRILDRGRGVAFLRAPGPGSSRDIPTAMLGALNYRRLLEPDFPVVEFYTDVERERNPRSIAQLNVASANDLQIEKFILDRLTPPTVCRTTEAEIAHARPMLRSLIGSLDADHLAEEKLDSDDAIEIAISAILEEGVRAAALGKIMQWADFAAGSRILDIAMAFSFPSSQALKNLATGESASRVFRINSTNSDTAAALLKRAWLGRTAPPAVSLAFRSLSDYTVDSAVQEVASQIATRLAIAPASAYELVTTSSARLPVVMHCIDAPAPQFVSQLLERLPGAALLLLTGLSATVKLGIEALSFSREAEATFSERAELFSRLLDDLAPVVEPREPRRAPNRPRPKKRSKKMLK